MTPEQLQQLPEYAATQNVRGAKITLIDAGAGGTEYTLGADLHFGEVAGAPVHHVEKVWLDEWKPVVGGYFVVHPENYLQYFVPAAQFEASYEVVSAPPPPEAGRGARDAQREPEAPPDAGRGGLFKKHKD